MGKSNQEQSRETHDTMTCREAEHQIFAERDALLDPDQRTALASHVAHCAACRRTQVNLASAIDTWRSAVSKVQVPDVDREWQAIRRRERTGASPVCRRADERRRTVLRWFTVPLAAAAAVAIGFYISSPSPPSPISVAAPAGALAPSPEDSSTVVFVDEKSGWLVVWTSATGPKQI